MNQQNLVAVTITYLSQPTRKMLNQCSMLRLSFHKRFNHQCQFTEPAPSWALVLWVISIQCRLSFVQQAMHIASTFHNANESEPRTKQYHIHNPTLGMWTASLQGQKLRSPCTLLKMPMTKKYELRPGPATIQQKSRFAIQSRKFRRRRIWTVDKH